ncbi:MAG: S41 family peptidase [Candidatus Taylorbacteria bacterium]|nr:S41 family peptidase [Candidatus Taylorbacteria bacterium]
MKSSGRAVWFVVLAAVLAGGAFFFGLNVGVTRILESYGAESVLNREPAAGVTADFSPFWRVWNILNEKHVDATSTPDSAKVWGAIDGLAASFNDPYTDFLPPDETKQFNEEISGKFEGIGIEIAIKEDALTVVAPLKDTPAYRTGILSGDKILQIDGTPTLGMKVEDAVRRIRGKKGTKVTLTLGREGKKEPLNLTVTRDTIRIPTIDTEIRKPAGAAGAKPSREAELRKKGVFVIKLYNFSAESPDLFRDALREFILSGSKKLIIDLRSNPGGYLNAAVEIASYFLPKDTIVVREDYGPKASESVYKSKGILSFPKTYKIVVLVNKGSASASEILAGALREHKAAVLVGERTFGKGSVQELIPVTDDTSIKVTIARWLTPNGVNISKEGLMPDLEVKMTPEDIEKKRDPQMDKAVELLLKP